MSRAHRPGGRSYSDGLDLTIDITSTASGMLGTGDVPLELVMVGRQHGKTAAGERELTSLRRDAAISLLLEAPRECAERAPLPGACGKCWPCRVDKFLRDAGVRR